MKYKDFGNCCIVSSIIDSTSIILFPFDLHLPFFHIQCNITLSWHVFSWQVTVNNFALHQEDCPAISLRPEVKVLWLNDLNLSGKSTSASQVGFICIAHLKDLKCRPKMNE